MAEGSNPDHQGQVSDGDAAAFPFNVRTRVIYTANGRRFHDAFELQGCSDSQAGLHSGSGCCSLPTGPPRRAKEYLSSIWRGPLELMARLTLGVSSMRVGEKAGIWDSKTETSRAGVLPLKVFHDFNLAFQVEGSPIVYPAEQFDPRGCEFIPERELQYSRSSSPSRRPLFPHATSGFVILLEARPRSHCDTCAVPA